MKKIIVLSSLLLAVVVLSGCFKKQTKTENSQQLVETSGKQENQAKSMAESIKDAIIKGKKMECISKVSSGTETAESKVYIQGEKYKTVTETKEGKFTAIFDGDMMYTWVEGTGQGTKIDMKCVDDFSEDFQDPDISSVPPKPKSTEEVVDGAVDMNCQPTGSIDFSVPSDINFIDQCEMLKKAQESLKNFNIPQMQQ